jgi:hypothetical protein
VGLGREKTERRKAAKAQRMNPSVDPTDSSTGRFAEKNKKRRKRPEGAFEVERFSPEDCNRE